MARRNYPIFLLLTALAALLVIPALAVEFSDAAAVDGVSLGIAMYCATQGLLSGTLGLLVGFSIALYGLYLITTGAGGFGIFLIVCGPLVTMLPSLIESSLSGLGAVLSRSATGISIYDNPGPKPPECP